MTQHFPSGDPDVNGKYRGNIGAEAVPGGKKRLKFIICRIYCITAFFYGIAGKLQQWKQELPGVGRGDMVFSG